VERQNPRRGPVVVWLDGHLRPNVSLSRAALLWSILRFIVPRISYGIEARNGAAHCTSKDRTRREM
jgi:hypothetical protein